MINAAEPRVFTAVRDDLSTVRLRVRRARRDELDAADMEQSRVFNQGLLGGLPPRSRLLRKLREQGLWTTEDDTRINTSREQVMRLDQELAGISKANTNLPWDDATTASFARATAERAKSFADLNQLRVEIDGMLTHTADAKADEAYRNFLIACVVERVDDSDGKVTVLGRVWETVDALMNEQDGRTLQRAVYEYMTFNAGSPSEWEANEAKAKAQEAAAAPVTPAPAEPAPVTMPTDSGITTGTPVAAEPVAVA